MLIKIMRPFLILLIFALFPIQLSLASAQSSFNIELNYAVGTSNYDTSTFSDKLKSVFYESYGVTGDRIKINKTGSASVDLKNSNWTIYDHYYSPNYPQDGSVPPQWSISHALNHPYFYYKEFYPKDKITYFTDINNEDNSLKNVYNRSKHIYLKEQDLYFLGYSKPGYKDFMIYPNMSSGEKTIQYAIYDDIATDALEGAGFLFNANIADGKINGYLIFNDYGDAKKIKLYKLNNVDVNAFHNEESSAISTISKNNPQAGIELIASKDPQGSANIKNIKIVITRNTLKFYQEDVPIYDTTETDSNIFIEDTGFGGFGPLVSYYGHECDALTYFIFKELSIDAHNLSFPDVVNQLKWQDNTKRFIVNLDDDGVPDFSNNEKANSIISRLRKDDVSYVGWGQNNSVVGVTPTVYNKIQAEHFINANLGKGVFINQSEVDYDTYEKGLTALAKYIYGSASALSEGNIGGGGGGSSGASTILSQTADVTFSDITNHWAKESIKRIASIKIIQGYPDGTFAPERFVTRAEFVLILARVFDYAKITPTETTTISFSDVASSEWYYQAVNRLVSEGIVTGYANGTFAPNKQITREETAVLVARMLSKLNVSMQKPDLKFKDTDKIQPWALTSVGKILSLGIIEGMPDGNFNPAGNTTRAQTAVIILRMLEKTNLQ